MKKIFLAVSAALLLATCVSCKKDVATKQDIPVQTGAVAQLIKNENPVSFSDNLNYEMGVKFKTSVKGNIKSFKLMLPATGTYRLTLWKAIDQSIIRSEQIACTNTHDWNESIHITLPVEANNEYILSVNTNQYYYIRQPAISFPYTTGSITLLEFTGAIGSAQIFPSFHFYPIGFMDFTFLPSE